VRDTYFNNDPRIVGIQQMDVHGAWEHLLDTYNVGLMALQVINMVVRWAAFHIDHIDFHEMTITHAMTSLQKHNTNIPFSQRYKPGAVAERVNPSSLMNECNNEINGIGAKIRFSALFLPRCSACSGCPWRLSLAPDRCSWPAPGASAQVRQHRRFCWRRR